MLLLFGIGVFLILLCAVIVLRRHKSQSYAVLMVAYALPMMRMEQALYSFAQHYATDCRHWYVYLPQTANLVQKERQHLFKILAGRWGFSLISSGECRRLWHNNSYHFYFISTAGVLYHINNQLNDDWQRLLTI